MKVIVLPFLFLAVMATAQTPPALQIKLNNDAAAIEAKMIEWRRYFHEHPELSNQELKTGVRIAEMLRGMGIAVQHPVAKTGVVGILKGGKPGPVVALRADMDALPITERNALPFASKTKVFFNGQNDVGVMHACGHDAHMAMLLATAEILSKNKGDLRGTVKFIFQPAEEGVAAYEGTAGAELMVREGVLENPKVDAIFGVHVQSLMPSGSLNYRSGALMAAVDAFDITVKGVGSHGATPWDSVDPIVVASQIVSALQTIVSRQVDLTENAAVITVGNMHGGIRRNIIPETVSMEGTIRTFGKAAQQLVHERIKTTAEKIAEASGAKAVVNITTGYPATINQPKLTEMMVPSLAKVVGKEQVKEIAPVTMAEDFSFFQEKVPGFFFFLGVHPASTMEREPAHHTADFMLDEKALITGVRALTLLTTDYLYINSKK